MTFKDDRIENEKNDPQEASSLKFIHVPIILIAIFFGFGITYLALRTNNTNMNPGDSRTDANAVQSQPTNATSDLAGLMEKGKQIYTTTCQACHQAAGAGIPGAFPPLAESEWVNGSPKRMVAIVLHGIQGSITVKTQKFQGAMPAFKDQLKPEDIAAVVTFVRNSFGNKSELVTPELVAQVKEETKSKTGPWGGEADLNSQSWK